MKLSHPFALALVAAVLAGCTSTTPAGKNGGTEQLRLSITPSLRSAGVSDACIQQLTRSDVTSIYSTLNNSPRSSRDWIKQRQRIRFTASQTCGQL